MTIRVTVWGENVHEQKNETVRSIYPDGMHTCIATALNKAGGISATTAVLQDAEHGMTEARLAETDVLVWWGHAAHGQVDLLINNAGVAMGGTFEQVSAHDFDWVMDINFNGVVRLTRAFLPLLKQRPVARIVNLSSLFGLIAPPEQCAYSASKFAVRGFSNALRHELAMTGASPSAFQSRWRPSSSAGSRAARCSGRG